MLLLVIVHMPWVSLFKIKSPPDVNAEPISCTRRREGNCLQEVIPLKPLLRELVSSSEQGLASLLPRRRHLHHCPAACAPPVPAS